VAVIPAYQIVGSETCRRGDVQCIEFASFRDNAGSKIGQGQRFHRISDSVNYGARLLYFSAENSSSLGCRECDFPDHSVGNHASAPNAIQQTQQTAHDLLPIARLPWGKAAPTHWFRCKTLRHPCWEL